MSDYLSCFHRYEKKTVSYFYKFCSLCTKFTPSILHVPFQKWQKSFEVDNTWVPIPYTSSWHYFEVNEPNSVFGASKGRRSWAWEYDIDEKRSNFIIFVGIIKKMQRDATVLRRELVSQCRYADNETSSLYSTVEFDNVCKPYVLSKDAWKNFGVEAALYRNSTFCLLPMGDIASRKAVFDMLLAGCVIIWL